jgi:hypothetical protein
MKTISALLVFCFAAGLAFAGDEAGKDGCPVACDKKAAGTSALATVRKEIAAIPEADAKLPKETLAEVKAAREGLMQTSFGKSMGPSFEACGWLLLAASAQPGNTPEATAALKDMGATYCSVAKMFGGCAEYKCCEDASECCEACTKGMTADALAKKANESAETAKKLYAAAIADMQNITPDQMAKMEGWLKTLEEKSPCMPAFKNATAALTEGLAGLAKTGVAIDGTSVRDQLVKTAAEIHGSMTACSSCEECDGGKCDEAKPEETAAPEKSS